MYTSTHTHEYMHTDPIDFLFKWDYYILGNPLVCSEVAEIYVCANGLLKMHIDALSN